MVRVKGRVQDRREPRLIDRYLRLGVMVWLTLGPAGDSGPQGGPLSPLLANVLLDDRDRALERRGHRFVRYADDLTNFAGSRRAGERVLASASHFLEKRLKLPVNGEKSGVDRPWPRTLIVFTFVGRKFRWRMSDKSIRAPRYKVRGLTRRTPGRSLSRIVAELCQMRLGWRAHFGNSEIPIPLRELEK